MYKPLLTICLSAVLMSMAAPAIAADGMSAVKSPRSVQATMDKLEALAKERGLTVFARVDHAAGAAKIGQTLRPTQLLIFGNPQGGTPFMNCAQSVGIDLPLKALVWEDAQAQVWVGTNDAAFIAKRHGVPDCAVAPNIAKAVGGLVEAATAP